MPTAGERAHDPANKAILIALAAAWLRLADLAEKDSKNDVALENAADVIAPGSVLGTR